MFARRRLAIGCVNAHDRLDDLPHVRRRSSVAALAARLCSLDRAADDNRRLGAWYDRVRRHADCGSGAFYNDRARAVGPGARDELPPRARWRESDDGSCHWDFCGQHRAVFMGCGTSAERIFFLASAGGGRVLRRVPQRGSVFAVRVLRVGDCAEIFSHRDLRLDQQGIRRHEAHAVFLLWRDVRVRRNTGGLRRWGVVGPESAVAVRIFTAAAIVGVSGVVPRLCCTGRHLAAAHLGADWPCRCPDCGLDVARGNRDEAWLLRRSARRDESFSAGISDVEQMDRCAGSNRNRVCSSSGTTPT
ncbi:MAG: hypothetical protein Udaeo_00040 [Candidatus Udaeobacter sp.]|nr:MAG: hypothetical protein Udaeo_00040 [Candidatus Udaeobacter sp.]